MLTFGSLFAGIGGFDLGLERAGMRCQWQVEIDPFCQQILAKHWPVVKRYADIRDCGKHNLPPVDLICGGFPCQPFSCAGKRGGKADDRYLWPEMLRVIREARPRWVVGENVAGIIAMELDTVLSDLEMEGYSTQAFVIPACGVNAPHRRDRVWIVGYADRKRLQVRRMLGRIRTEEMESSERETINCSDQDVADFSESRLEGTTGEKLQRRSDGFASISRWLPEPQLGRVAHGIPRRVDRLKSLGNAVVPQIVEVIGRMIIDVETS